MTPERKDDGMVLSVLRSDDRGGIKATSTAL
jgi:hypothetical protein